MNIIISNSIQNYCRVCLKSSGPLFSCQTKMVFNDASLTIKEVLNILTPQKVSDPPYYPINICFTCKEFVQTTFVLKTTFEKTNTLLESLFTTYRKKQEENQQTTIIIDESSNEEDNSYDIHDVDNDEINVNNSEGILSEIPVVSTHTTNKNVHYEEYSDDDPKINVKLEDEIIFSNETSPIKIIVEDDSVSSNCNEDTKDMGYTYNINDTAYNLNIKSEVEIATQKNLGTIKSSITENSKQNYMRVEQNDRESKTIAKHLRGNVNFPFNRTSMKVDGKPLFQQAYICPICKEELQNSKELRKHASSHKLLKKYFNNKTITKIPKNVKIIAQPREIYNNSTKDNFLYICPFCKVDLTIENFQDHIHSHFSQGDFMCTQCDRVFRKLGHLNAHVTVVHKEELPYQCNHCEKGFTIKYNYDCHLLTHQTLPEELPHKCAHCDKGFANKQFLRRHMFSHSVSHSHWKKSRVNKCKICLRTFETLNELKDHQTASDCKPALINFRKLPLKYWVEQNVSKPPVTRELCALCGACVFNMKQHIRQRHTPKDGTEPVKKLCNLCGARVLYMKQHMKSHEPKPKPVECHMCNKKLSSKLTLIKHIRVHTGERPYPCKYCDKRFKDLHTKSVHERTHTGIRKHICSICGKGFLEKSYMLKHMRGVHK